MSAMIGCPLLPVGVFAGNEFAGLSPLTSCGNQQQSLNARNSPFRLAKKQAWSMFSLLWKA
jgi:hypothetical protein